MTIPTDEKVRNTKTGTIGYVVGRHIHTRTGKTIVEVQTFRLMGKTSYWQAANVEAA